VMLQSVAWIGIYGLSFLTVLAASLPALFGMASLAPISPGRRLAPAVGAGLLILVPGLLGALRLQTTPTADTGIWLRIVQPSIPQTMKWDPTAAERNFRLLLDLSGAPATRPIAAVVWPEAATPFLLGRDGSRRRQIGTIASGRGYVITGAVRANPPPGPVVQIWNSLEALDGDGDIVARYDKAHLVPFGEYVPFRDVLPWKKITVGSVDYTAGPGPRTINLPGLPRFAPLICYEVVFPHAIVDEDALYAALKDGRLGGAALDVWWQYPTQAEPERRPSRRPFHELPNVLITPHCSSATDATAERRWSVVAGNLDRFARGEKLENIVLQT